MITLNERITEDIVREHFKKDSDYSQIILEEQKSVNPRINKLLQNASKSGHGVGKPEFIISLKYDNNLIIIVECKADTLKHESASRDKYRDYAVDGVCLYSSYLSKDFDVLSIAVSGIEKESIKVSYFIQRKGTFETERIFGNRLLALEDLKAGLSQDEKKRIEKYENILLYSKILNSELHSLHIKEDKRSLLLSGILLALENDDFYRDYYNLSSSQALANFVVDTIKIQLEKSGISPNKIDVLLANYRFIKTDHKLTGREQSDKELKTLIRDIDENINSYARTYKYYDIIGQFYIEFLKYSNADKGLGIVLTPPHITDFFCDLVDLKATDTVFDNCAGTGGFLVSAMKKMISKANGDLTLEKKIKKEQLYGIERQPEIYPLTVSNMFLHGDGKSNIFHGSCFNEEIIKQIKEIKPNIAFLNPPYKADKGNDIEEFQFVLSALDCIQKHGTCVAIIPMSCVLATKGERLALKEKLLESHRLKAVLSMPTELFHNSKVNVGTCIVIFEAHIPHSEKIETFFGYFKDDGFTKRKEKGRFDYSKQWESIKENWINLYFNNKSNSQLSVSKTVGAKHEWCAEAYMNTQDYHNISYVDFYQTLRDYIIFLFSNSIIESVSKDSLCKEDVHLGCVSNWGEFKITDLFEIKGSKTTPPLDFLGHKNGQYPYVTTQATNNGVEGFFDFFTENGGVLTVDSAVLGSTFYQQFHFSASDHVEKLEPIFDMNIYIALFLVAVLNKEQYRYNYARKASQTRLKSISIRLPALSKTEPDWRFMENYIKSLPYSSNL